MKRYKDFIAERCWPGHKPVPGKKPYSPGSCVKEESLDEMDKSAPQPGRDGKISHSTYGSRDKGDDFKGKQLLAKQITVKKMEKDALDILKKQGVAEGAPELLKKEMPLHRHAEKLLAQNGVSKDDPDYHHHLGNTIKHLRQFGNIDLINKQGVAEEVEQIDEVAAWQRKEGKSESGGLNRKGIESYRRENPGSKLSMAVTTKPSKLKPGSKAANRRKSFCARMGGMKKRLTSAKTANDPDSRINKALRKWNC
jgi:hypothetical protein